MPQCCRVRGATDALQLEMFMRSNLHFTESNLAEEWRRGSGGIKTEAGRLLQVSQEAQHREVLGGN